MGEEREREGPSVSKPRGSVENGNPGSSLLSTAKPLELSLRVC